MPPSIRKACEACARAKRRCRPQLPRCPRCQKAGIACRYDLEPLSHYVPNTSELDAQSSSLSNIHPSPPFFLFDSLAKAHRAVTCVLGVRNGPSNRPEVRYLIDPELMQLGISYIKRIVDLQARGYSPFIHHELRSSSWIGVTPPSPAHAPATQGGAATSTLCEHKRKVLSDSRTLIQTLLEVEGLLLHLIKTQLRGSGCSPEKSRDTFSTLAERAALLWSVTPSDLGHSSPWKAWLLAESVRRTIFATRFIRIALNAVRDGYAVYADFIETLPFDPRAGLWEAETEEAWQAISAQRGGLHTVLVSFREFLQDYYERPDWQHPGLFHSMLLMGKYSEDEISHPL